MGYSILHDSEQDRAVLFCTTSETALTHQAFAGPDCVEQAEDFLYWLGGDPRDLALIRARVFGGSPAVPDYSLLDSALSAWWAIAFDDAGDFVPLAERGRA